MITIKPSLTSDLKIEEVTKEMLKKDSLMHISDVVQGLTFFAVMLAKAANKHDFDKLTNLDTFYKDFKNKFKTTEWWDEHRKINRHHLTIEDGVPNNVNLIDVIEMIVDCIVAGKARTGTVYDVELDDKVLKKAFKNTVTLFLNEVTIDYNKED